MKILFVNQYYWPDLAATAQQLTDLAEHLAAPRHGHEVHVLCAQALYEKQPGVELKAREVRQGVQIHRLKQWGSRTRGILGRLLGYVGFDAGCKLWLLAKGWKYDVIVTLTEPPLIGLFGVMMRVLSFGRIKHLAWSMDLYTDCMFALGSLSPRNPVGMFFEWLNRIELKRANAVVVLGECMRERLLRKGVRNDRMHTIGVWNRADQLTPMSPEQTPLRAEHNLQSKFIVMYSGNAGRSHSFEAICQAMVDLRDDPRIVFLFVGGGKRLADIEQFARDKNLENFMKLPYFPREQLNESLAMGNAHLVSLHPNMSGVVVPCKLYGIMAVARPVLFVGPSDSTVAREVNSADAGVAVAVDDSASLTSAIRRLADDARECARLGENGRNFFLKQHEREICCDQWEALLHEIVDPQARRAQAPRPLAAIDRSGSASA